MSEFESCEKCYGKLDNFIKVFSNLDSKTINWIKETLQAYFNGNEIYTLIPDTDQIYEPDYEDIENDELETISVGEDGWISLFQMRDSTFYLYDYSNLDYPRIFRID